MHPDKVLPAIIEAGADRLVVGKTGRAGDIGKVNIVEPDIDVALVMGKGAVDGQLLLTRRQEDEIPVIVRLKRGGVQAGRVGGPDFRQPHPGLGR